MKIRMAHRISMLSVAAALAFPPVAMAANEAERDAVGTGGAASSDAGEIIVTAQKREERLRDVPVSVSSATGDTLRDLGITSAADLGKIAPGFSYAQTGYGAPIFTVRGIGFYDEAVAVAPAVSVYVDQVPLPFSRMTEGVGLDIERVEVLKGPQGTLFGNNSTGGAINYIAAKPTDKFAAGATASYARFNSVNLQGYVSGPLSETLTARIAARLERSGDWQKSVTSNDSFGQRNFVQGRILLNFAPSKTANFLLSINGWRNRSDVQAPQFRKYSGSIPTPLDGSPSYTGSTGSASQPTLISDLKTYPVRDGDRYADRDPGRDWRRNDRFYQISLRSDIDLSDTIQLTSLTSYSDLKVASPVEGDGTRYLDLFNTTRARTKTFAQEIRISGVLGQEDRLRYMLGVNYQHDNTSDMQVLEIDGTNAILLGIPLDGPGGINAATQRIKSGAVFGGIDYRLSQQLSLQASVRYTDERRNYRGCNRDNGGGVYSTAFGFLSNVLNGVFSIPNPGDPSYIPPGGCTTLRGVDFRPAGVLTTQLNEDNIAWRINLSWKPENDLMFYINATRGFKSGSLGTLPYISDTQLRPVKQEQNTAYETGFKGLLFDRKLDLSAAAFYYDYKNKQLLGYIYTGPVFGNFPGEVSIPKSRVYGFELNATVYPVERLRFLGGITYVNSKITSDFINTTPDSIYALQPAISPLCPPGSTIGTCGVNIKGSKFVYTPDWQLQGDVQYEFPVSSNWSMYLGANVSYRSSTFAVFSTPPSGSTGFFSTADDYRIPGYALLDLRAGFKNSDGSISAQIWGRNVTNKYYWNNVFRTQDSINRITGRPAEYGVTLSYKY